MGISRLIRCYFWSKLILYDSDCAPTRLYLDLCTHHQSPIFSGLSDCGQIFKHIGINMLNLNCQNITPCCKLTYSFWISKGAIDMG